MYTQHGYRIFIRALNRAIHRYAGKLQCLVPVANNYMVDLYSKACK